MARILVAEDDKAVRSFVSRALGMRGHAVAEAGNGAAALAALRSGTPFDLLITDVVMPEMDGVALAEAVGRDHPGLPVLMMTGYAADRTRNRDLHEIAWRVLSKPFTLRALCEAAEALLRLGSGSKPSPCKAGTGDR